MTPTEIVTVVLVVAVLAGLVFLYVRNRKRR